MIHDDALTRRELLQQGITAGFALAVLPVAATAANETKDGIVAETIAIPLGAQKLKMPAYWAMPEGNGPFPVVLVIHEIFGVHAYIQDVCRRLAKEGYLAVAPYLYFREGDVTKLKGIPEIKKVVDKVPQRQVWSDLDDVIDWLDDNRKANTAKVAITGFCWGGTVVWMYASQNPRLKAGVAWYGRVTGQSSDGSVKYPVDVAEGLRVPVLGLYGEKDGGIPVDTVERMRAELKKGKSKSEIKLYKDAEHGFHADYRPSYHKKSAQDGWKRMLKWFKKHGMKK